MNELLKRIGQVEQSVETAKDCVDKHGRNGLSALDNTSRLVRDLKAWAEHMECANESSAFPELREDGQVVYSRGRD